MSSATCRDATLWSCLSQPYNRRTPHMSLASGAVDRDTYRGKRAPRSQIPTETAPGCGHRRRVPPRGTPEYRMTFSLPDVGKLQLVVSGSSGELFLDVLTSETGEFLCRKGTVIMRRSARWQLGAAPGVGRTAVTFELHPLDNYLIVARKEHDLVLAGFLLPMQWRSTSWFRFERTGLNKASSGN